MKTINPQKSIIWDRVQSNIQLVDKITHQQIKSSNSKYLNHTLDQNRSHRYESSSLSPTNINSIALTRKILTLSFKQEQEKSRRIFNKLAYMRNSQQKQQKSLSIAKKNLQRLASIRKDSVKQKQLLIKMKETLAVQQDSNKQIITREVRSSRKSRIQAIQKWRNCVLQTAQGIRAQKNKFHDVLQKQKNVSIYSNMKKAQQVRKSLQKSRISIAQSFALKIQNTKQKHRRDLQIRVKQLTHSKRKNQKMYDTLILQTQKLADWQGQKKKEIQQFKSCWSSYRQNPGNQSLQSLNHHNHNHNSTK